MAGTPIAPTSRTLHLPVNPSPRIAPVTEYARAFALRLARPRAERLAALADSLATATPPPLALASPLLRRLGRELSAAGAPRTSGSRPGVHGTVRAIDHSSVTYVRCVLGAMRE